jgi:hypothetical protein
MIDLPRLSRRFCLAAGSFAMLRQEDLTLRPQLHALSLRCNGLSDYDRPSDFHARTAAPLGRAGAHQRFPCLTQLLRDGFR